MLWAKLIVVGGDAKTKEVVLKLPATVGRGKESSLVVPHALVSRKHCEIFERNGVLVVRDLNSLNGTFVDNFRIKGEQPLHSGQLLTLGNITFRADYQPSLQSSPAAVAGPSVGGPSVGGQSNPITAERGPEPSAELLLQKTVAARSSNETLELPIPTPVDYSSSASTPPEIPTPAAVVPAGAIAPSVAGDTGSVARESVLRAQQQALALNARQRNPNGPEKSHDPVGGSPNSSASQGSPTPTPAPPTATRPVAESPRPVFVSAVPVVQPPADDSGFIDLDGLNFVSPEHSISLSAIQSLPNDQASQVSFVGQVGEGVNPAAVSQIELVVVPEGHAKTAKVDTEALRDFIRRNPK